MTHLFRTATAVAAFALLAGAAHANTVLTVYTALEADQIAAYKAAFEKANPDIEIKWVRDSTGIVTAKLLAEKAAPRADAVWGPRPGGFSVAFLSFKRS